MDGCDLLRREWVIRRSGPRGPIIRVNQTKERIDCFPWLSHLSWRMYAGSKTGIEFAGSRVVRLRELVLGFTQPMPLVTCLYALQILRSPEICSTIRSFAQDVSSSPSRDISSEATFLRGFVTVVACLPPPSLGCCLRVNLIKQTIRISGYARSLIFISLSLSMYVYPPPIFLQLLEDREGQIFSGILSLERWASDWGRKTTTNVTPKCMVPTHSIGLSSSNLVLLIEDY